MHAMEYRTMTVCLSTCMHMVHVHTKPNIYTHTSMHVNACNVFIYIHAQNEAYDVVVFFHGSHYTLYTYICADRGKERWPYAYIHTCTE